METSCWEAAATEVNDITRALYQSVFTRLNATDSGADHCGQLKLLAVIPLTRELCFGSHQYVVEIILGVVL